MLLTFLCGQRGKKKLKVIKHGQGVDMQFSTENIFPPSSMKMSKPCVFPPLTLLFLN